MSSRLTARRFPTKMVRMETTRWRAGVLAFTAALLLSCPGEEPPERPAFEVPQWQSGETSVYHVIRNDSVLYETRVTLRFDEETIRLAQGPRSVPTMVVTTTAVPVEAATYYFDSSKVVFRRDSLIALRSHRQLDTELATIAIDASYEPGRVTIRKETMDGIEEAVRATPGWTLDQDMVRTVLRAVPPVAGSEFTLTVVSPLGFRVRTVPVQILGTRLVVTPTDSVVCREYEYDARARTIRLWYEIAQPRRLIGFSDPANDIEVRLVGYEPAGTDPFALPE